MTGLVVSGVGVVAPPPGADGPWFDPRERLGPRGYKYLPSACRYLLAAAREAVADAGGLDAVPPEQRGAAIGTNNGLDPVLDRMDRTVAEDGADALSPATAPFFAVNVLGSRLSAEQGLQAFHLTTTSPRVAGLEAVEAGSRALALGRGRVLLAGAMEDGAPGHPAEEGAVVLVLEPEGRTPGIGTVTVRTLFAPSGGDPGLADRIAAGLAALAADARPPVHTVLDASPVSERVLRAVGTAPGERHPAGPGCLAPMLLLARLLAEARDALMVAATATGNLALVRVRPGIPRRETSC